MADPYIGQIASVGFTFAPYGWAQCIGQQILVSQEQALFSLLGYTYGGHGPTFQIPDLRGRMVVGAGQSPYLGLTLQPGAAGGHASVTLSAAQVPAHTHPATGSTTLSNMSAKGDVSLPVTAELSNQAVTVTGSMVATTDNAGSDKPQAGNTFGDVTSTTKIYATPNPSTAVSLAAITSTGQLSAQATGTASGNVTLGVTGSPATAISVGPNTTTPWQAVPTMPPYLALLNIIATQGTYPVRGD